MKSADWMKKASDLFGTYAKMRHRLGLKNYKNEDFREWALSKGLPPPHHPNTWGAFTLYLSSAGRIKWTGGYSKAVSPKTHSHPVKMWRIV